ncbi:MAG: DUF922 domain-containing protein [Sphingomicrobium sp.]
MNDEIALTLRRLEVEVLPILIALGLAGQQPRAVDLIVNSERLGRTKKYGAPRPALRPLAPGELARLSDVPNVAVTYYEVAGRDLAAIHKSLARLGARDPRTRRVLPATSRWTVGVKIHSLTTAGRCTVLGATLDFRGFATLPRLVPDKDRPAAIAALWAAYVARPRSAPGRAAAFCLRPFG